jgi:hypothetical protein
MDMVIYATNTVFNAWSFVALKGKKWDTDDSENKTERVYTILECTMSAKSRGVYYITEESLPYCIFW